MMKTHIICTGIVAVPQWPSRLSLLPSLLIAIAETGHVTLWRNDPTHGSLVSGSYIFLSFSFLFLFRLFPPGSFDGSNGLEKEVCLGKQTG